MRRALLTSVLCVLAGLAGVWLAGRRPGPPPEPIVLEKVREVARLEALDVTLFRKVAFAPDPSPTGSSLGDVLAWAKFTLRPPKGRAVLFAKAHVGLPLDKVTLRSHGREIEVVLPPLATQIELMPGETEIIDSNLDSAQTAQLFEVAKTDFANEIAKDQAVQERARSSAQRAIRDLLQASGFEKVTFVGSLTGT